MLVWSALLRSERLGRQGGRPLRSLQPTDKAHPQLIPLVHPQDLTDMVSAMIAQQHLVLIDPVILFMEKNQIHPDQSDGINSLSMAAVWLLNR